MTYNDLQKEVLALGFESSLPNEGVMLSAVRRAISFISSEIPLVSTLTLYKHRYTPKESFPDFTHKPASPEVFTPKAVAYSFKSYGDGSCRITDASGEREILLSGEDNICRGFLVGESKIEFLGDLSYRISNFSVFDELYGASPEDVPLLDGSYSFKISDCASDFLAFLTSPKDSYGREISGVSLFGDTVTLPDSFFGKINISYRAKPNLPSGAPDESLSLPPGCEHLLALLTAAYVWLDDDSDKAQYYMALYRDGINSVKLGNRRHIDKEFHDVYGWC